MQLNVGKEVAALKRMTTRELRARYAEAFGEGTNANNRAWLVKRIAWRLQVQAEGGLSERARRRADELANDADLRLSPPWEKVVTETPDHPEMPAPRGKGDERVPPPGSIITRAVRSFSSARFSFRSSRISRRASSKVRPSRRALSGCSSRGFRSARPVRTHI